MEEGDKSFMDEMNQSLTAGCSSLEVRNGDDSCAAECILGIYARARKMYIVVSDPRRLLGQRLTIFCKA